MPTPPEHEDDLTRITGIGGRTEAKLKQAGIHTFTDLGRTDAERLAAITGYSTDHIEQKDWIGRARALARAPSSRASSDADVRPPGRHNFTVELQLEAASGTVLSSKVHHVQSGDGDSWRGWDASRVISFIESRAETDRRTATESTAHQDLPGPRARLKERAREWPSPVALAQVRAERLLFPGSGPMIATLMLDASQLEASDISATELAVDIYAQRPPFSKSRLLGQAVTSLRGEPGFSLDVDLTDPRSQWQLEVFAVLTFFNGVNVDVSPISAELAGVRLTLQSRL